MVPQRWDRRVPAAAADNSGPTRPSRSFTLLIGTLCLAMTGGVVYLWKNGLLEPGRAAALTTRPTLASESITASLDSARKYMNQAEWAKAEAILRQAAMEYPDDQEVRIALAEDLVAQKKFDEAYDQYEKSLAIGPREGKIEFAAGLVANTAGKADLALEHFFAAQTADTIED